MSDFQILELDEVYHFTNKRPRTETRENAYVMTMVSRFPRQIAGFDVAAEKCSRRIQAMVDGAPWAQKYCTDGYLGYLDVVYPGEHVRNVRDKRDTFTVESVNADLRHYIPLLARRSRCFPRSIETLYAVVAVFAQRTIDLAGRKRSGRHIIRASVVRLRSWTFCSVNAFQTHLNKCNILTRHILCSILYTIKARR